MDDDVEVNEEIMAEVDASDSYFCQLCSSFDEADKMLLCNDCDKGFHMFCMDPPLKFLPPSDEEWFCAACSSKRKKNSVSKDKEKQLETVERKNNVSKDKEKQQELLSTFQSRLMEERINDRWMKCDIGINAIPLSEMRAAQVWQYTDI